MSLEITLCREEVETLREAFRDVMGEVGKLPAPMALALTDAVLQRLFDEYGGARVYFKRDRVTLSPETLAAIEQRLLAGEGCRHIARTLEVSHTSVIRIRRRMSELLTVSTRFSDDQVG